MTDSRKNIKLSEDLFERLKTDKPDHMNWPTYLEQRCLDDDRVLSDADVQAIVDAIGR